MPNGEEAENLPEEEEKPEGKSLGERAQEAKQDVKQLSKAAAKLAAQNYIGAALDALKSPLFRKILSGIFIVLACFLFIGTAILLMACTPCLDGYCGRTPTKGVEIVKNQDLLQEILAWSGSEKELIKLILSKGPDLKKKIDEIIEQKKSSKDEKDQKLVENLGKIKKQIDIILATGADTYQKRIAAAKEIMRLSKEVRKLLYIPSATADLDRIAAKPITKVIAKTGEKRIYFYTEGDILGNAPINISGLEAIPAPEAKCNDNKTPLGNFTLGYKEGRPGANIISTSGRPMGPYFIRIESEQQMGSCKMTERGIAIHGNAPQNEGIYPAPTAGCLRMFNRDLEIVAPYLNPGTPIEIAT